jgi:cytidine deaminase
MQLNQRNENMEILTDYNTRKTVTLKEIMPYWWGKERCEKAQQ